MNEPLTCLYRGAKPLVGVRNAGVNLVCKDACAVCCKPLPTCSSKSDLQWLVPTNSRVIPVAQGQNRGTHKVALNAGRGWLYASLHSFHRRSQGLTGDLSTRCCADLRRDNGVDM